MDPAESWDIDEELDFLIADLLLSQRSNLPTNKKN
jgi:CMP-N-acetylneuraminic acid synthetase